MESRNTTYVQTLGIRLLRELTAKGYIVFSSDEARGIGSRLGISADYLRVLISQLVRGGWLTRLRRGIYAVTVPVRDYYDLWRLFTAFNNEIDRAALPVPQAQVRT